MAFVLAILLGPTLCAWPAWAAIGRAKTRLARSGWSGGHAGAYWATTGWCYLWMGMFCLTTVWIHRLSFDYVGWWLLVAIAGSATLVLTRVTGWVLGLWAGGLSRVERNVGRGPVAAWPEQPGQRSQR